ncbi:phage holin family protein [Negativicoccus succinicivorans]|uniref:phage holin family protein n=1 Tax=Negativicoccus succinicivorans TaxID=620903 RepID=UPI002352D324|nr:phage holin family protein [Negativicoccus succinicivorans]
MVKELNEIIQGVSEAMTRLADAWWVKSAFSAIGGAAVCLIQIKHIQVLGVFILLVLLDLATKWSAIAYQMLIEKGAKPENISGADKWLAIPMAFAEKRITSRFCRKGFIYKVITYTIATAAGFCWDFMTGAGFAVNLVWMYLGASEFLSILENLRDGGNVAMGRFLELVKDKIEKRVKL